MPAQRQNGLGSRKPKGIIVNTCVGFAGRAPLSEPRVLKELSSVPVRVDQFFAKKLVNEGGTAEQTPAP